MRYLLCALLPLLAAATEVPAWRDAASATRFLGPDRLWRCRETLLFHLQDDAGTGFRVAVDLRDMNTYVQGPRPVLLCVEGPDGRMVARQVVEDDGKVAGDDAHHDGVPDMYGDLRYRSYWLHHSPTGCAPGKSRSPSLAQPEQLPARSVSLAVPAAGPGLYRLMVVGTWDTWVAITPDRPLATAIHPGPAPLYLHGATLDGAWLWTPPNVQDLGFAISEEVRPWSWQLDIQDEAGKTVGKIAPKSLYNYVLLRQAKPDALYQLRLQPGQPGACLHLKGAPMLLCPDAATARRFHAGLVLDAKGRPAYHAFQTTLYQWADSLKPADLALALAPADPAVGLPDKDGKPSKFVLADIPRILAAQQLDPAQANYGDFAPTGDDALDKRLHPFWLPGAAILARVAGWDDPRNPYYGHPALARRTLLYLVGKRLSRQTPWFWFENNEDPATFPERQEGFWGLPYRSNWYPLQDANFAVMLGPIRAQLPYALPPAVTDALRSSLEDWGIGRTVAQQGECTNQWAKGLEHLVDIWFATRNYELQSVMQRQIDMFTTPGYLGRVNPDSDPWSSRGKVGYGNAADSGIIGAAIPAEQLGHDGEYCLQTVSHLSYIHSLLPNPKILTWLNGYYDFKTHLTLPRGADWPKAAFSDTCSPTDTNFRTRYYTHKSGLNGAEREVKYGDIWAGQKNDATPWPALRPDSFTHSIDDRYVFLKTPAYYGILYTGPNAPSWLSWTQPEIGAGSVEWVGYGGVHYGGYGYKASKLGALSALYVSGCGPTLLSQNHNVMYTHNVWGRLPGTICQATEPDLVDPHVIAECYAQPTTRYQADTRLLTRSAAIDYTPLAVDRRIAFADDALDVTLTLTASAAATFTELHEAVPVFLQNRQVKLYGAELQPVAYELPKEIVTPQNAYKSDPYPLTGEDAALPIVNARAIDVTAKNGAGALILFDQAHDFSQVHPLRYRDAAAPTGSFNLNLPLAWQPGQTLSLHYRIVPHTKPLAAADLQRLIAR